MRDILGMSPGAGPPNQIKHLRQTRGMSRRALADEVGTSPGQIQKLENGERRLDQRWMERLSGPLGVEPAALLPPGVSRGPHPTHKQTGRAKTLPSGNEAVIAIQRKGHAQSLSPSGEEAITEAKMALVPELDVRASAGGGASDPTEISDGQVPIVANWQLPLEFLRQFSPGPSPGLAIITAIGSSMQPVIQPGTKLLVDTGDRNPSPPGLFVTYDGFGIVVKHVQPIPFSEPKRVKLSSANPLVDPYERIEGEAYIQGRVVGFWTPT